MLERDRPRRGFDERQRAFARRFGGSEDDWFPRGTAVIVPSITFPISELRKIIGIQHYEERLLCMLLHLDNPAVRIVYVTSLPIEARIVDYYLSFLRDASDARERLHLATVDDASVRALTAKLLETPAVLGDVRALVERSDDAFLLTFNTTPLEAELADELQLPLYGAAPDLVELGSKSGARRVAESAGVAVLPGAGDLRSLDEIEHALRDLRERHPAVQAAVIKLNNGFSGQGNAIVEIDQLRSPLDSSPTTFCAREESWPSFAAKIEADGAIVEELVRAPGTVSPSVQMRIGPTGRSEVISTHDQILGGPEDQVYLGCRFPAADDYRSEIQTQARAMGRFLALRGVIGPFGVDFVVIEGDPTRIYMSEINLRMGGTTHPFEMAKLALSARYDARHGRLLADGRERFYVATDNLKDERYVGLQPEQVMSAMQLNGLAFEPTIGHGVTLHLFGTLARFGKLGLVAIANSPTAVDDLYRDAIVALDDLAETAADRAADTAN